VALTRIRLPARLALLFLVAGLLPLAVVLLVLLPRGEDALRTSAKLLHEAKADALRVEIDEMVGRIIKDARLLTLKASKKSGADERADLLRFLLERHAELTIVTLFDEGRRIDRGQAFDRRMVTDADLGAHLTAAAGLIDPQHPTAGASGFYRDAAKQDVRITLLTPVGRDAPSLALATELSLHRIQSIIETTRVGRRGRAFLVDRDGRVVAHPDRALALARADLSHLPVVARLKENIVRAAAGRSLTAVVDFEEDGKGKVGAYAPLDRLGWGLVVEELREDAYGLARATWLNAALWTGLSLLLLCVLAVIVARAITARLGGLRRGTQALVRGEFGFSVPEVGAPELRSLARAFNEASRRLAEYDRENQELLAAVERGYLETLRALVNAIEAKDPYTAGHSQRTAEFSIAIANALGLPEAEVNEVEYGGLLHDIGKMGIPEHILRKPAMLEPDEMNVMQGHPSIGGEMTFGVAFLEKIRPMIRNHHERMDGTGYPDRLRGEEIPLGARIVAVADAYDALTSDRPYQPSRPPAAALSVLERLTPHKLDPRVVAALRQALAARGELDAPPDEGPAVVASHDSERTGRVDLLDPAIKAAERG
jgi:putative nucleotidyltransferase with HDIG domain